MQDGRSLQLAVTAGREVGLDVSGAVIRRSAASVHVEFPAVAAMARVELPERLAVGLSMAAAARFLDGTDVGTIRLIAADRQPMIYEEGVVTLWERVTAAADCT